MRINLATGVAVIALVAVSGCKKKHDVDSTTTVTTAPMSSATPASASPATAAPDGSGDLHNHDPTITTTTTKSSN